ncbi:MAG: CBS domain-containing protein [Gammaproteobacteria bacterium]|nr:CBS domain-containing protein [Gammaproteobacteria bacterium]MCP5318722.1 CBS domain-containing protein [Chromatiaceae bacterium]MCW5587340.1 CBS domain-containing protein [Chromatiales bacterium]MCB1819264.1 CBS domain-containing protein [Gammaproteobacteria bacterium]MCP5435589.1 CBS domain-containing protein [Chromatiaceae bacterium]
MRLMKAVIETPVARHGMLIGDALRICVDKGVPGIPFVDNDTGRIIGRFSVRNVFLHYSIPSDMIKGAHLIGHEALHLDLSSDHYEDVFRRTIDCTILDDAACLTSTAQITKAMALMEKFNSSYLFVIDDGVYRGVVTRLGLTRVLLDEQG